MGWLSRLLNYVPAAERKGISLEEKNCWLIDFKKSDIALFLREMGRLFPKGSIIYLEGISIDSDLRKYLDLLRATNTTKLEIGTIWPRPEMFHIPLTTDYLCKLADFLDTHAVPELCDHLHVYKDDEVLLQGFDISDRKVFLSKKIDEALVRKFCATVGCNYAEEDDRA